MELKELEKELGHTYDNVWTEVDASEEAKIMEFSEGYKEFLDCKTERECVKVIKKMAEERGFVDYEEVIKSKEIKPGMKIYAINRDKSAVLMIVGKENIENGMNIVGSHIDSPRIDLKPVPLYEDSSIALLKTHYYGGIKKYQWAATPLALHGVVFKEDGTRVDVTIGEDENDPVFFITDLLPHLAKDQMVKKMGEGINGEELNVLIGSKPVEDKEVKNRYKLNVLKLLHEKYAIKEVDLVSSELCIVPAGKARDVGLDRSMVMGYGQDDSVCAYTSLIAALETENPTKTAVCMFTDKEEVGSQGNTGAQSSFFRDFVAEMIHLQVENYSDVYKTRALKNSKVLSADVGAAYDPTFSSAYEKQNSAILGAGLQVVKYTGARGKGGCNDANAEFVNDVTRLFTQNNVVWQTGELGKVDQGGGGTIAYILANDNADVIDCGVPVLSMHGTNEVTSKADVYMAYKGYKAFMNR